MKEIRTVELFGGIGAKSEAMRNVFPEGQVKVVSYAELDKHATKSFNAINGTNFEPKDINDVDVNGWGHIDLMTAGWPCQDLSVAGKGAGIWGDQKAEAIRVFNKFERTRTMEKLVMEKRSGLIFTTIQTIQRMDIKPDRVLLENVKGLVSKKWERDVDLIKGMFGIMGYTWQQVILNSKYFGVPQARERVFILLTRKELPQKDITHLADRKVVDKVLKDVLDFTEPTQTIKIQTIDETDYGKGVNKEYTNYIYLPPTNPEKPLNNLMGRRLWKSDKYVGTIPAGDRPKVYFHNKMSQYNGKVIEVDLNKMENQKRDQINKVGTLGTLDNGFESIPYKQSARGMGIEGTHPTLAARMPGDIGYLVFNNKGVKFAQDRTFNGIEGMSGTLTAQGGDFKNKVIYDEDMVIHYRKLSVKECWRLMGFSDESFNKVKEAGVSPSQMAKQAGNSIVVNVLEAIIKEIFND